ncbi:MAG: cation transporter [Thermodesulfobacteriota bacterium]
MSHSLGKRALFLSYFTVIYNIGEGVISIVAGYYAGSASLVGFGLDSFIESLSGGVMIWRFRNHDSISKELEERIEKKAVRLVGYTFFILAAYLLYESTTKLYFGEPPEPTLMGIIIAAVSLIVMPVLFLAKRRTGRELGAGSLVADSKQTLACTLLSAALLVGLGLNYLFGLWQADPIAGLVIVAFLVKEGYAALTKKELCCC